MNNLSKACFVYYASDNEHSQMKLGQLLCIKFQAVLQIDDGNLTALLTAYNGSIASVHEDTSVSTVSIQYDAPWSLDRIDQPSLPLDGAFNFDNLGSNIYVYIIDTVGPLFW